MQNKTLLYDNFNAKYLSYQQVADSFIPNIEFDQLKGNSSILLMGPRGCGKTTLLKMLTPACLHYWKGTEAEFFRNSLPFTAIYIPSDIQWKNQLDYLKIHLGETNKFSEIVTQFLFTTNIQIALCKTFHSIIAFGNFTEEEKLTKESHVCKSLIGAWEIEGPLSPTFDEIEFNLLKRVSRVNSLVKKNIFVKSDNRTFNDLPLYIFTDFFSLVQLGCKIFEQELNLNPDFKWALCFDELEIAPKFLQILLINYLRSVDQKFLFKLTTTPLFNLENNIVEASQGNDFGTIKLWVYDESGLIKWREFCQKLIFSRLKLKFNFDDTKTFENIFGKYSLDEIIKDELDQLDPTIKKELEYPGSFRHGTSKVSSINFLFKYLAKNDTSFAEFLNKRSITPTDPYSNNPKQTKSIFLKYKTDAVFRLIYKNRTRRTPPIHYGLPYLFDICDGNPRLVIGLVDEILLKSKYDMDSNILISKNEQSQVVFEASNKYFNLLKNHPNSTIIVRDSEFNLANDILEPVGKYMNDKIIQDEFSVTSPSTFIIDDDINYRLVKLLDQALYLGAIVYLDPIESISNTGIIGKRFRLSNFLIPKFKIPNRSFSQVNLSTILRIQREKNQLQMDYKK